jgi:hypothetical protein
MTEERKDEQIDERIRRSIVRVTPFLGSLSAIAIIWAALCVPQSEDTRRIIWALIVTVPPAWFALEWSYRFTDEEKQNPEKRAAIIHTQSLYTRFWIAAATGIGLLYFGDSALKAIVEAIKP